MEEGSFRLKGIHRKLEGMIHVHAEVEKSIKNAAWTKHPLIDKRALKQSNIIQQPYV